MVVVQCAEVDYIELKVAVMRGFNSWPNNAQVAEHAISLMWSAPSLKRVAATRVGQVYCWSSHNRVRIAYVYTEGDIPAVCLDNDKTSRLLLHHANDKLVVEQDHRRQQDTDRQICGFQDVASPLRRACDYDPRHGYTFSAAGLTKRRQSSIIPDQTGC